MMKNKKKIIFIFIFFIINLQFTHTHQKSVGQLVEHFGNAVGQFSNKIAVL